MPKYVARNRMISESGRVQRNHKKCGQDSLGMLEIFLYRQELAQKLEPFLRQVVQALALIRI